VTNIVSSTRPPIYVHAAWNDRADYDAGHIPSAIYLDVADLETPWPEFRLRSLAELHKIVGDLGISPEDHVIVSSRWLLAATRAWWILTYMGVRKVELLDGGPDAWSGDLVTETTSMPAKAFDAEPREHLRAKVSDIERGLRIADTRSRAEFEGKVSGYSYIQARGRIPGALWAGDEFEYRRGQSLRAQEEVLTLWSRCGIARDPQGQFVQPVAFSCGGGWRSSLAFYHAWSAGIRNVLHFDGGWGEWSTNYVSDPFDEGLTPGWRQEPTNRPIETG